MQMFISNLSFPPDVSVSGFPLHFTKVFVFNFIGYAYHLRLCPMIISFYDWVRGGGDKLGAGPMTYNHPLNHTSPDQPINHMNIF